MPLYTYRDLRQPRSLDELGELDRQRLVICGRRYDGEDLTLEQRLSSDPERDDVWSGLGDEFLQIWAIDEDGRHAYDLWHYMVDSGTIFKAGTTEVFGDVIQFGFGGIGGEPNPIADALERAFHERRRSRGEKE